MSKLVTSICVIGVIIVKAQSFSDIDSENIMQFLANYSISQNVKDDANSQSIIIQHGNDNVTDLFLINDKVNALQLGDNNTTYYRDSNAAQVSEMTISLQGNNNLVQVEGSNSISNGMGIEIIGNNKAVFVENK